MYFTIAYLRVKPGMESKLAEQMRELEAAYVHRMDAESDDFCVTVAFDSREAYTANANSPEQHSRNLALRELLVDEPEYMTVRMCIDRAD